MISNFRRQIKNTANNFSVVTVKTREATSNAPALPTDDELKYLSSQTYDSLRFVEMMCVVWKRLCDSPKSWRHVYKSLVVLEHLILYGDLMVVEQSKTNIDILRRLNNFQLYEGGVDHGLVVREVVTRVLELLNLPANQLQERRMAAMSESKQKKNRPLSSASVVPKSTSKSANRQSKRFVDYAPKTADEEETQLQMVLALSRQSVTSSRSPGYGIQSALAFAAQDQSQVSETNEKLSGIGPPPPSPAILDFDLDYPVVKTVETTMANLVDISVPISAPIASTIPISDPISAYIPASEVKSATNIKSTNSADTFDWLSDYNVTLLKNCNDQAINEKPSIQTSSQESTSEVGTWNPFGSTHPFTSSQPSIQVNPFTF